MVSSRLALLALAAVVALATSVVAQTCVVTVTAYASTDTTCSGSAAATNTIGSGTCSSSLSGLNVQYVQPSCNSFDDASSGWTLDAWSSNACTGAYSGRVISSGASCATYQTGGSVGSGNYYKVNCSCSSVLPAVSSSSADAVSSSSAMSTGGSSSSTGARVIDYGCPRTVNVYSDSACSTLATSYTSIYSFGCAPVTIASQSAYAFLQCNSASAASNWQLTTYSSATCAGSSYFDKTPASAAAPNACQSAPIVGLGSTVYLTVNCSCYGGRHYSTGSTASLASTGVSGVTSMTSMTGNTASLTSMSGMTSNTGSTTGTTGSTTGRTSSAPASRSSVVAIVAAAVAAVVAMV